MITRAIKATASVLGLVCLLNPLVTFADQESVSASTTFHITVYVAPTTDYNPRLSDAHSASGSNGNCANRLAESGLAVDALDRESERLARNFFCRTSAGQYKVASHNDVIVLTSTPV